MTAYIFYDHTNGPEERSAKEFAAKLSVSKVDTKLIEFDAAEAIPLRELYDIMSHPAVVLARMDGSLIEKWQHQLPLVADVSYLAHS